MSKQHTPKTISQYIDREITDIRIKVYSGASSDEIEHRLHGLNLSVIDKLEKMQNNHDRLVEALDRTSKALQKITLLARKDEWFLTDLKEAMEQYQEAKQLLTELKS